MTAHYSADDYGEIQKHLDRVRRENMPKCPRAEDRLLWDCLHHQTQCSDGCPFKDDWVGPNG